MCISMHRALWTSRIATLQQCRQTAVCHMCFVVCFVLCFVVCFVMYLVCQADCRTESRPGICAKSAPDWRVTAVKGPLCKISPGNATAAAQQQQQQRRQEQQHGSSKSRPRKTEFRAESADQVGGLSCEATSGILWRRPADILGTSCERPAGLGKAALGAFSVRLGGVLGGLGEVLGGSWGVLGGSWRGLGTKAG